MHYEVMHYENVDCITYPYLQDYNLIPHFTGPFLSEPSSWVAGKGGVLAARTCGNYGAVGQHIPQQRVL